MPNDCGEILLVEDSANDVELTLRALKKHNLANLVQILTDGAQALEYIFADNSSGEGRKPRLIILDLKLPKVSGLEVLQRIKSDERTKTIPVIILTSSQEERDLIDSYRYGANSYVVKPVNFDKFVDAVAQLGLYWLVVNKVPGQ
jgi:DNA-binding response OmpR family regulator